MDDTPQDEQLVLVVTTSPWTVFRFGRETIPYQELEAELRRAEQRFESLSWRRSVVEERMQLTVAEPAQGLVIVERLLRRPS